jgi:lipopolysaccharide export system permease protein
VLLGTLITFTTLSQNSEVVAMKAAGLSAHQILAPMILASLFVAGISFAFNDQVVAPASAKLKVWQDVDYAEIPKDDGTRYNVWVREGRDLIQARTVVGKGNATRLEDVRVYQRTNGSLTQVIRAEKAGFVDGAWKLEKVRIFEVAAAEQKQVASLVLGRGIEPKRFDQKKVNGDALGFIPLAKAVDEMKAAGRRTDALEGNLWHKISGPLSAVLMPLLGAVAAFGLARSGALFLRAVIGMALGFAYFVADNFALAMGNLGAYPPFVAAWAPFLLFLLIGETVLVRTEE